MKQIILIGWFLLCIRCFGQTTDIQQLILNIEKLAQMKATYRATVDGYRTLEKGYARVSSFTKGNFDLHKDYLDGLMAVNPAVKQNTKVDAVMQKQRALVEEQAAAYRQMQLSGMFRADELASLKETLRQLVQNSVSPIDELIDVLTPGRMRMNDEERLSVISKVDVEVGVLLEKLRAVVAEHRRAAEQRARRKKDANALKVLYGLKQ